ncbi:MAG: PAS domain S-box protein [Deltaproteobacteria bacterium]|nr:PAS domain S-box protein [Deltaproteobacteria bacterium]
MSDESSQPPAAFDRAGPYRRLGRSCRLGMHEDELLQRFAEILQDELPGCQACFRLVDAPGSLSLVYATGPLRPEQRQRLVVPRPAPGGWTAERLAEWGFALDDAYRPVFASGANGFALLLHHAGEILGLLNLEWPEGTPPPESAVRDGLEGLAATFAAVLMGTRLGAEVRHLRDRLAKLLDHADAPILLVDVHRRVRLFNRCLERLTGRSRSEVLGRDATLLLPPEEHARFSAAVLAALRGRPTANYELRLPRVGSGSGGHVLLSFNIASVVGADGESADEVIAVGQDLTEIRRLQRQMIHTEKLATIGQLAAGVVHEINNPLTSVSIHADYLAKLMEREQRGPQEITFINRIRDAAARILRFTQDLMSFARPAGDEPEQFDLPAVLDQSAAFCEHVIAKAGVTLERSFEPAPKIYGIRQQIQQVFINLITNACHAMAGVDGPRVLTLAVADNGDGRVRAEVRDTGTGIPEEIRDEIFEPFFTTKREGEGTGLGLSIVRNLIDKHQAEIRVDSQVGRGSTFLLLFYAV